MRFTLLLAWGLGGEPSKGKRKEQVSVGLLQKSMQALSPATPMKEVPSVRTG